MSYMGDLGEGALRLESTRDYIQKALGVFVEIVVKTRNLASTFQ